MKRFIFQSLSTLTDAQLVAAYQQTPENRIFAELYNRYFDKLRIYCLKSLSNDQTAEDIAQDVMIRAFERLNSLKNPESWVAWLFSIARNEVRSIHRQQMKKRLEPVTDPLLLADDPAERENMEETDRKLAALPDLLENTACGQILKLKYMDGQTIDQLCQDFGMNESALKMKLLRARKKVVQLYYRRYARA